MMRSPSARAWLLAGALALTATQAGCAVAAGAAVAVGGAGLFVLGSDLHQSRCDSEGCLYSNLAAIGLMTIGAGLAVGGVSVAVISAHAE